MKNLQQYPHTKPWHSIDLEEIFKHLNTSPNGLAYSEASERVKRYGENRIAEQRFDSAFIIFFNQFRNPLVYILVAASAVSFLLGHLLDSAIIGGAVLINTAIGFFQELKVSNILRELNKAVSYKAIVIRDGKSKQIDSQHVALGDIIVLRQGDKIPADARLIKITNFKTNEAALTGESMPIEKTTGILKEELAVADQTNMVFMGTFAEEGYAEAVVVNTGANTEFGKIAALISGRQGKDTTPLQKRLGGLARQLAMLFVTLSAGLFVLGTLTGRGALEMFLTAVAVAVAAVPEGLPAALSVTLAIGAKRILEKGGLVRKMVAAEALGSTTVIAADKTNTLTEGKMRLSALYTSEGKMIKSDGFVKIIEEDGADAAYLALKFSSLVSDAFVENPLDPLKDWKITGRPIDRAIVFSLGQYGFERWLLEEDMPRVSELPFDSVHKYSASLNKYDGQRNVVAVLGAPETIIELSDKLYRSGDGSEALNDSGRQGLQDQIADLASQGFRILAVGFKYVSADKSDLSHQDLAGLNFLSLVIFSDPIRPEVKQAIERSKSAGLRTIVITGDYALTAEYVSKELGITTGGRTINGQDLPNNLSGTVMNYDIFARVTPEDKVRIVKALRDNGEVVAMIGDGINDAPALLEADLGVAVGSGTDVAKEASDLVLLNDSFSIIVEAIRQGRIILDNIRKAFLFLMASSFTEVILITASIILGMPLALLPAHILWVNIIVDGLPAIALAFEKGESVMRRRPEKEQIFTGDMKKLIAIFNIISGAAIFVLFYECLNATNNVEYARTMTFAGLGLTALFYIYSVRSLHIPAWRINPFSNKLLVFGVVIGFGLYAAAIYWPFLRTILGTTVLTLKDWAVLTALGLFSLLTIELCKMLILNGKNKKK